MSVQFEPKTKAVVTVSEMARMVGLSRARFYQLIGTTFPYPVYSVSTRRPNFVEEQQKVCLEVRRKNCGIDGKPVLFYARRNGLAPAVTRRRKPKTNDRFSEILDGVKALGLTKATASEVEEAVRGSFPQWEKGTDPTEVIRAVFMYLKRQNPADNVG